MSPKTTGILKALKDFPWFEHVGEPLGDDFVRVDNWKQAVTHCATSGWESVQLQVSNCLARNVNLTNYARFKEWNETTIEMNRCIDEILCNVLGHLTNQLGLPKRFGECVSWDITLACQEAEFSDVWPPIFFLDQVLPLYQRGHFPCGWQGPKLPPGWDEPLPPGKLIVF